jgi:hypothetical protein
VEKYATAEQATDDSIVRCMRVACRVTRATDLHLEYVILIAFFTATNVKANAPHVTFIRNVLYIACRVDC